MAANRKYASLDIGTVRVGVALSDPETGIALPLTTVYLKESRDPYAEIEALVRDNEVTHVVVGWPLELDGTEGPAIRRTKQFLARLRQQCPQIKLIPQDERLTSCAAENALQTLDVKGSDKKHLVDAMAAALILQTYLDTKGSVSKRPGQTPGL